MLLLKKQVVSQTMPKILKTKYCIYLLQPAIKIWNEKKQFLHQMFSILELY